MTDTFREASPLNFLIKIQPFSMLSKNSIQKYESKLFEVGDYLWKLVLYPDGNKNQDGGDNHISLYLELVDPSDSHNPFSINVFFKLFLYDQIRDRYLVREDMEGNTRRFHEPKKVWGFTQFISLVKFNDPNNGYLVNDTCMFGVELFIANPTSIIESLMPMKEVTTEIHTWKIENFSALEVEFLASEEFKAGGYDWYISLYPNGYDTAKDDSASLYLHLIDEDNRASQVFTCFKLRIMDQIYGKHIEFSKDNCWFNASSTNNIDGKHMFIALSEMNDKEKGYLVNDTCIVEAEVKVLATAEVKGTIHEKKFTF